jgi:hypothetical protein
MGNNNTVTATKNSTASVFQQDNDTVTVNNGVPAAKASGVSGKTVQQRAGQRVTRSFVRNLDGARKFVGGQAHAVRSPR